ncbi:MAG: FecR family protein [Bacteroidota bacterium]|nr:FecR family protein [Bacteroidota bacterium]
MEYNASERVWQLMARKLSNEASEAELIELEQLLRSQTDEAHSLEIMEALWKPGMQQRMQHSEMKYKELLRRMQEIGIQMQGLNNTEEDHLVSIVTEPKKKTSIFSFTKKRMAIAAAVTGIMIMAGIYLNQLPAKETKVVPVQRSEVITRNGSKTRLTLPDGTKVWLNAGSKLSYPNTFGNALREVALTGEAFFDVTKNPQKPFVIHTSKMDIRVLGTAFNVKCYPDEKKIETSLIRGSIEVTLKDRPTEKIYLKPNEKLTLINDEVITERKPNAGKKKTEESILAEPMVTIGYITHQPADNSVVETSWVENKLVFRGETFEEVALKMERWYGVTINIANENLKKEHLTGAFEKENITQALDALELTTDFKYVISKNNITITK